ncbi:MAG: hypothetical protein ACF788_06295 [Novipirellula sp. JB048]
MMLEVAKWALHNGLLEQCKSLLSAAWRVDPSHAKLRKLAGLVPYLNRPVAANQAIEDEARELVSGKSMRISRSKHFFLFHERFGQLIEFYRKIQDIDIEVTAGETLRGYPKRGLTLWRRVEFSC